ncbi:MAG TPA: hypothetical protein VGB65_01805 [Allosphingosinicella sp.]|jgi:hypothetical protein
MKIRIFVALLALGASMPAVAAAQGAPPRTAEEAVDRLQALGQWMQRITDALAPSNEAGVAFFQAVQGSTSGDPAQALAKLPELRAATAKWREALAVSEARLSRIQPLEQGATPVPAAQVNQVLTDARELVSAMQQLAADTDQLTLALERGDVAAVRELAPKLVRGGFLQIRQQVTIYRGRQAMLPPTRSAHQMAAVTIRMYEAMSVAAESWFAASAGQQRGAAATQRANFLEIAGLLEKEVAFGRRNLAREKATFASLKTQVKDGGSRALIAAAEPMAKLSADAFLIGDELVAWLRSRADTSQDVLAKQQHPELFAELVQFEQRYVSVMAQAAAAMGQIRR